MRAWVVDDYKGAAYYVVIVYGETRGQAIRNAFKTDWYEGSDWHYMEMRAKRVPILDGEPHAVTPVEYLKAGFTYTCECEAVIDPDFCYSVKPNGDVLCSNCSWRPLWGLCWRDMQDGKDGGMW